MRFADNAVPVTPGSGPWVCAPRRVRTRRRAWRGRARGDRRGAGGRWWRRREEGGEVLSSSQRAAEQPAGRAVPTMQRAGTLQRRDRSTRPCPVVDSRAVWTALGRAQGGRCSPTLHGTSRVPADWRGGRGPAGWQDLPSTRGKKRSPPFSARPSFGRRIPCRRRSCLRSR